VSLYALHIASGEAGAFHDVLSPTFTSFLPGLPLYFSFDYAATRTTGSSPATLHVELRWYDATGAALTPWTNDTILNATIADTLQKFTVVPPAGATSGKCYIKVTPAASPMQHEVWIKKLRLGKTELSATNGADWSANVSSRPTNLTVLAGTEGIQNSLVAIGSNGALFGGGGGQVTIGGLGFSGELNADNTANHAAVGDANRVRFSHMEKGTQGWSLISNPASLSGGIGTTVLGGRPTFYGQYFWTGPNQFFQVGTTYGAGAAERIPVTAGERVFIGARVNIDVGSVVGSTWVLYSHFYDSTGAYITTFQLDSGVNDAGGIQRGDFVTVPAGGHTCIIFVQLSNGTTGTTYGTVYIAEPLVCAAGALQTTFPRFTPGPGAEPGATLGAIWSGNLTGRPSNLAALSGSEGVNNGLVSIGSNGALSGGGGGMVTIGGLGGGPWATYSSLQPENLSAQATNLFPYPRGAGATDGRTPAQLGWFLTAASSGWGELLGGTTDWTGGGYYQAQRPGASSGVIDLYPFYDMPWNDGGGFPIAASVSGYATGGTFSPYVEYINAAKSAVLGSFNLNYNSASDRYEGTGTTPTGTAFVRFVGHGNYPVSGSPADLTFWAIKVERNTYATRYSDPPDMLSRRGGYRRLGDQRNIPAVRVANVGSNFTGAITYTAQADDATHASGTINVSAGNLIMGDVVLPISAMSANISGTPGGGAAYSFYIVNPNYNSGSFTLIVTTTANDVVSADGRMWIGGAVIVFPSYGSPPADGGGTVGGGGRSLDDPFQ
jgi:hypothetical protein